MYLKVVVNLKDSTIYVVILYFNIADIRIVVIRIFHLKDDSKVVFEVKNLDVVKEVFKRIEVKVLKSDIKNFIDTEKEDFDDIVLEENLNVQILKVENSVFNSLNKKENFLNFPIDHFVTVNGKEIHIGEDSQVENLVFKIKL